MQPSTHEKNRGLLGFLDAAVLHEEDSRLEGRVCFGDAGLLRRFADRYFRRISVLGMRAKRSNIRRSAKRAAVKRSVRR